MKFLKFKTTFAISAMALALFASCSDDDPDPNPEPEVKNDFHIAFANGSESNSATLVQGVSDLSQGTVSAQIGHEMESSRTARIFASSNGSTIYSLNYTEGTIEKLTYQGADKYTQVGRIDASIPLGNKTVRFIKLDDEIGSVHYIRATAQYSEEDETEYLGHKMVASIGMLDLATMTMKDGYNSTIDVVLDENLTKQGYYISRIDCPVLSGSKLYYGAAVSKFNASTGKAEATDRTFTLVLDYPSLTNATAISTTHVKGATE